MKNTTFFALFLATLPASALAQTPTPSTPTPVLETPTPEPTASASPVPSVEVPSVTPEATVETGIIAGSIIDNQTGKPITDGIITLADPTIQFKLGSDGKFRFPPVPPGPHTLFIACHGYKLLTQEFQLPRGATLKLEIRLIAVSAQDDPGLTVSDTITVTAERESIAPARRTLQREEVRLVPGAWGDPFRAVQNLPGVSRSFLGFFGELAVRGSAPEDTRLYVDGHEVPLLYHFGGLKSLINAQSIDQIVFVPGGFGAFYGRATGGVLDAKTRTDIPDRLKFHLQTDLLDTSIFAQMPVGTGAVSIALRRSYIDVLIRGVAAAIGENTLAPRY